MVRILIVGAGEVGTSIAADLADTHEVVVVDRDPDRVDAITRILDVLAIEGDGTALETLEDARVEAADIAIAATDHDETNLAVCATVSAVSDTFTIGQVEEETYLETWREAHGTFGANLLVNSRLRAARAVASIVDLPMAHEFEEFANGTVQAVEFEVGEASSAAGAAASTVAGSEYDAVGVIREGAVHTPADVTLTPDDHVVVVGTPDGVSSAAARVTPGDQTDAVEDILLLGGGTTGGQVARRLEARDRSPRMVVEDVDRAHALENELPETTILVHDATDPAFLERENVGSADVAVVDFDTDQRSLLASMLVRQRGVDRTLTVVEDAKFDRLFEAAGVDVAVHPRAEAAEEISRFTRGRRAENVAIIERDVAEVFELVLEQGSDLVGRTVEATEGDLPGGVRVGAIVRGGDYRTPQPGTEFESGDHVVVFTPAAESSEVVDRL